jgi:predicted 2-oxoglutarate/Fe(II)-dependent dioxygenase YbiX
MFNTQLKDYVRKYSGFFDESFCKDFVASIENINWELHGFYNSQTKQTQSYDHELSVSREQVPLKNHLDQMIWNILQQYVTKDMAHMSQWFGGWTGYSLSRFNRYNESTQMKLHCDHIYTLFDGERKGVPILTVLGALNNDYEGGEFVLCGEQIEFKAGEVLVFPSNFLYPHEVKPVKSGTRYSFVSWAW